jgi:predicted ATPase
MNELKGYLEGAIQDETHTILITGEAGIGKTRLVHELLQVAQARGFQILSSNCEYESLTPYMPFIKALKFGSLDHLFAEEAPRVEAVYLVTHGGVLIKEVLRHETKLRPDIFASMLTAVSNFVKESLSIMSGKEKEGELNTLGYENYRILIESGNSANLVVLLTGKENEFLINDIKKIHSNVEKNYQLVLKNWDGNETKIKGIEQFMVPIITSSKYDGVFLGEYDPKAKRDLLFENVTMGLIRKSEETPLLLCIEDLQWSDPSSLALLYHVSRNSKNSRLVILGTYRPEEVTLKKDTKQPLTEIIQLMDHEGLINRIELSRLPETSITEFLNNVLGIGETDNALSNFIYHETEGNPLFIIQLVKYMIEENIIIYIDGTWKLAHDVAELNIPPKIYQVIALRLDRLEKGYRKVLEYASVIGETFSSTILGEALNVQRLELLDQLRELEQKHKLIHSDNGNYRFDHGKIKEVVYSEIPLELRTEYHSIIARMIEKLNKDRLHEVIEELAFHYYQCKNKEKAHFYLLEAAKKAKKNYSNSEAIRFYREALELEESELNRRDILDSMGQIYDLMGEYDQALETYSSALGLISEPEKLAEVKAKLGIIYLKKGDYDNSLSYSTEALDLVKGANSSEEALALETIGQAYQRKGEYETAIKHHEKVMEIYQKVGNQKGIASSFQNLGMVFLDRGEHDKALKNFNNGLKIYEQLNDTQGIQNCYNNIGALHFQKGEYKKAFEYYEKGYAIIEKTSDQSNQAFLLLNIGHSLLLIGETKKALDNLERSLAISKNNDLHMLTACNYWVMSEAYIDLGNLNMALDYCNRAFDLTINLGNKEIIGSLRRVLGIIYMKQKNWELSIENFKESIKILSEITNDKELGDSYYEFGLMWKEKGETEFANENLKNAYNIFEKLKLNNNKENVKAILETL